MEDLSLTLEQVTAQEEENLHGRAENVCSNGVSVVGRVAIPVQDLEALRELNRQIEVLVLKHVVHQCVEASLDLLLPPLRNRPGFKLLP
jgi:hypothetical protein